MHPLLVIQAGWKREVKVRKSFFRFVPNFEPTRLRPNGNAIACAIWKLTDAQ